MVALAGVATVQDAGRPGLMHQGVPEGGALVVELLGAANAAARNALGEAALEVFGSLTVAARGAPCLVANDDGQACVLADGETWSVTCARARVRYLAVRGGVDAPRVLGGRGTLLVAGLGGHEGRPLRKGDRLRVGSSEEREATAPPPPDVVAPIRVLPGPDTERFAPPAVETLLGTPFFVSERSDRVGVRLRGQALGRVGDDSGVSSPMVRGAIQVPVSGEPIVLGPDHPTIGGYPVIATVALAHLGALFARPVGGLVRFSR
ncbi:MAG TPA: biotin-dependent carboxyltransferase family protein [Polyangiaceae bacterium]|nr:biotin-dependent carboxyltransferase family protein [Polyangiaceae bacterium]